MSVKTVRLIWIGIVISVFPILLDIWNLHYFTQVYKFHVIDSRVEIPPDIRWGTYKPWLLVALSEAVVEADRHSFALLYHGASNNQKELRYATQDRLELENGSVNFDYFTDLHDPSQFTVQTIKDNYYGMNLTSKFLVNSSKESQTWFGSLELSSASPSLSNSSQMLSLLLMFKIEALDIALRETWLSSPFFNCIDGASGVEPFCDKQYNPNITIQIMNTTDSNDSFNGYIVEACSNCHLRFSYVNSVSKKDIWESDKYALEKETNINGTWLLDSKFPDQNEARNTSMIVVQALIPYKELNGSSVSISFTNGQSLNKTVSSVQTWAAETAQSAGECLKKKEASFSQKFKEVYIEENGDRIQNDSLRLGLNLTQCSLKSFSMLQAGLSLFWGSIKSENKTGLTEDLEARLLTMIPSRDNFYRGYFWEEGLHQLVNVWMYPNVTLLSMRTWFNLMDEKGWIAREQIRGEEAKAFFEGSDSVMYTNITNPATMAITLGILSSFEDLDATYLNETWSKMLKYYNYFSVSQKGNKELSNKFSIENYIYRWTTKSLTDDSDNPYMGSSGLDDYPRKNTNDPSLPYFNLDLHCWMILFAQYMNKTAFLSKTSLENIQGSKDYSTVFSSLVKNLTQNLDDHFYDALFNIYKEPLDFESTVFSEHIGYVNLFPFLFNLGSKMSLTKVRKSYLSLLQEEEQLGSSFGIRSLALDDSMYDKDYYWRGNIWVSFNYLVLRAIRLYYWDDPTLGKDFQDLYHGIRDNITMTVCGALEETGYLWETFDSETGEPQNKHPFAGSSSLIVLIIAEKYDF